MNLNTLIQEHSVAKKAFFERAQGQLKEAFKQVFELYPEVNAFVWTQYSPYFNDGEECVFSVNDVTWTNLPDDELGNVRYGEYDGEIEEVYHGTSWREQKPDAEFFAIEGSCNGVLPPALRDRDMQPLYDLLRALCSNALEDVMEETFGNHVKVIATREGFDIDVECEHH